MNPTSLYRRFVILWLIPLILWWHSVVTTLQLALRNDEFTHILLVLPISIGLIFAEWRLRKPQPQPNYGAGLTLLAIAVLVRTMGGEFGRVASAGDDVRLSFGMLAVVVWWIGSFVCCFGTSAAGICSFPLCFLLWLVPLPAFALNHIITFLQRGSADVAHLLFAVARVPVTQDGVRLSIPGLTVEVAKECSSIRSSLMLVFTCMVVSHLWLRSAWSKSLIILSAVALSIAKNGLRIFILSMLAVYVDPGFLHGWLHHDGGIVFFLLSTVSLFFLLRLVERAERVRT